MGPLEGIKVVEFATYVAAPAATRLLADFGAEVIKIESFAGDGYRSNAHIYGMPRTDDREDPCFDIASCNKRFIALDLRKPEGRDVLFELLEDADVFVANARTPSLARLGLTYDDLKDRFPRVVYAHMLGYGENGKHADEAGYDYTCYAARGGVIGSLYEKGAEGPCPSGPAFGDMQSATYLALAIETALLGRERTGKGDYVSVSLHGVGVYNLSLLHAARQDGYEYPASRKYAQTPTNNMYQSRDGRWIELCVPDYNRDFDHFVTAIGREDLVGDERYNNITTLRENGKLREFVALVEDAFAQKDMLEWHDTLKENDIAHENCLVSSEVLEDEECWLNGFVQNYTYPTGDERIVFNNPIRIKSLGIPEYHPSVGVGTDTEAVMKELGMSDERIAELEENGVILQHAADDFVRTK